MPVTTEVGPFRPVAGKMPPCLAGREEEQSRFREVMDQLRSGSPVARSVAVFGPRGNGTTALLRWAKREADADDGLEAGWLVGSDLRTAADLVNGLGLGPWIEEIDPGSLSVDEVGVPPRLGRSRPPLAEALEARAKAAPLSVFLDEAHTLEPEMGLWLPDAAQVAGRRAPFLLVVGGAPGLLLRFSEIGAGFMERAQQLPLGRLDETAAAEAIRRPLVEDGLAVEEEALEHMVRESRGYPFFVRLWGQAVWNRVRLRGAGRVTTAVVEEAAGEFAAERDRYYDDRRRELENGGLLPAARAVAEAFRGETLLRSAAFRRAIGRSGGVGPERGVAGVLERLGCVRHPGGTPSREPGIPGLRDYLPERAPPSDDEGAVSG